MSEVHHKTSMCWEETEEIWPREYDIYPKDNNNFITLSTSLLFDSTLKNKTIHSVIGTKTL